MYVRQMLLGPMQNFVYLFGAEGAREVAVVDPAWEVDAIFAALEEDDKELVAVFVTHHHRDHINGVPEVLARRPGLPVYAQSREIAFSDALRAFGDALRPVEPDETVSVGSLEVKCIHTPGHTPGAHCLLAAGRLFTGDTLFICGCGRCDLPGGDPRQMFHSLHGTLAALPDETVVYPGHDYADRPVSTLGEEKRDNPYFQRKTIEEFVAYRMRPR
ncbi:MAG TPA: MBL fold metallo-hydrolase [Fredinandcohnia sp.]|nr:MBL fold metallo-hydrolase [Fredinandcohnia sp.]